MVFGLHNQVAAQSVMGGNGFAAVQLPSTRVETERFAGQRADGTQIDDVARQLGFHRFADKGHDFGVFTAIRHRNFLQAGDFFGETYAAGAVDAAAHLLGGNQRPHVFADDGTFFFGVAAGSFAVAHCQILQLAFAALVAGRTVERMVDEQELHHAFLRLAGFCRMRAHNHAVRYRRGTGRQRFGGFFHVHQTHTAVGGDGELFVVTEMRNISTELVRGLNHRRALLHRYLFAVDFDL